MIAECSARYNRNPTEFGVFRRSQTSKEIVCSTGRIRRDDPNAVLGESIC
jgi:hypothetical protein